MEVETDWLISISFLSLVGVAWIGASDLNFEPCQPRLGERPQRVGLCLRDEVCIARWQCFIIRSSLDGKQVIFEVRAGLRASTI